MARAHWATVAKRIADTRGVSWNEARAIYRDLSRHTQEVHGHRPGLVDIGRYGDIVESARQRVSPLTLEGQLIARGFDNAEQWRTQSTVFANVGLLPHEISQLAAILTKAQNQVEKSGRIWKRTKQALADLFADLQETYAGLSSADFFALQRKLY